MPRSISIRTISLAGAALGLLHGSTTAAAVDPATLGVVCTDRPSIVAFLDMVFAEHSVGAGLGSDGQIYEVFAATSGATWTFVVTDEAGVSCVVAVGEGWARPVDRRLEPVQQDRL